MKKNDDMTCPECGQRMHYDAQQSRVVCGHCGCVPLERLAQKNRANPRRPVKITHRGEVNMRALSAFNTAHDHLQQGDKAAAAAALQRAAECQSDFVDAYYWLALLAEAEADKRKHLSMVLALDPSHPEALRAMMVLNGQLTPEQAAHTYHYDDQQVRQAAAPVDASAQALLCPVCSGNLTVNEATGAVTCRFCGHTELRAPRRDSGPESLAMALIARKASPVRWVVGERLLHCQECGARRTVAARKLSDECPFCGSTHVILKDALESFEQPDGIVRFALDEQQARSALAESLHSLRQRIASIFDSNRVKQVTLSGLYLPFWVFDATVEVAVTRTYKGGGYGRRGSGYRVPNVSQARIESRVADAVYDVAVCGVQSPPPALTQRLLPYDLDAAAAYDARLLARHPAELYSMDFDRASLAAREKISRDLRDKYRSQHSGDDQYEVTVFPAVQNMSFRLLLLPVWVAAITEEDGDQRRALINGQTGKTALGKPEKRRPKG